MSAEVKWFDTVEVQPVVGKAIKRGRLARERVRSTTPPLIWQAMEQADGYTYPILGQQIALHAKPSSVGMLGLAREIKATVANKTLNKIVALLTKEDK